MTILVNYIKKITIIKPSGSTTLDDAVVLTAGFVLFSRIILRVIQELYSFSR